MGNISGNCARGAALRTYACWVQSSSLTRSTRQWLGAPIWMPNRSPERTRADVYDKDTASSSPPCAKVRNRGAAAGFGFLAVMLGHGG